jgi:hypothetical protein
MLARSFGMLGQAGRSNLIETLIKDMQTRHIPVTSGCYTALVTSYYKQGRQREVHHNLIHFATILHAVHAVTLSASCTCASKLLSCECLCDELTVVDSVITACSTRSCHVSFYYSILLAYIVLLIFSSVCTQALQKLRELRSDGAPVRVAAYTSVISGCKWAKVCVHLYFIHTKHVCSHCIHYACMQTLHYLLQYSILLLQLRRRAVSVLICLKCTQLNQPACILGDRSKAMKCSKLNKSSLLRRFHVSVCCYVVGLVTSNGIVS